MALRSFQDDGPGWVGLPDGNGGVGFRFFQHFFPFDVDQVLPQDSPQFHRGGGIVLNAVSGWDDFFADAPIQVGGAVFDDAVG